MAKTGNDANKEKIIHGKCGSCQSMVDSRLLFNVLNKKMCLSCGNKEIQWWNMAVRDAEGSNG